MEVIFFIYCLALFVVEGYLIDTIKMMKVSNGGSPFIKMRA
jgi:hypothetical protein